MSRRTNRNLVSILALTLVGGSLLYLVSHRSKGNAPSQPGQSTGSQSLVDAPGSSTPKTLSSAQSSATGVREVTVISSVTPTTPINPTTRPAVPAAGQLPLLVNQFTPAAPPTPYSATAVADGKAKIDAGDLLTGRKILNDAIIGGRLSATETATAKQLISKVNENLIFSPQRLTSDNWVGSYVVRDHDVMQKIAARNGLNSELLCRINNLPDPRKLRAGANIKILQGPFHAVVTKHAFTMDLYLGSPAEKGSLYVTTFPVGLGKDNTTPTGTWMVEKRQPNPIYYSPRGEGIIAAGDPKNPLGKFWIALAGTGGEAVGKTSYGIHGTIDPDSIGKMASMGCIRMKNEDVARVFEMLVAENSIVVVKD